MEISINIMNMTLGNLGKIWPRKLANDVSNWHKQDTLDNNECALL